MLELVKAVEFIRAMGSGRNKPLLFGCEDPNGGARIEAVVKFSKPECGVGGLVRETISALLAADLKLPIPRPLLVVLEDGLLGAMEMVPTETIDMIATSRSPTFGCELVSGGLSTFSPARTIAPRSEREAAEIFAFDALVLNPDRRVGNSNLLYNGDDFLIFDHELALNCTGIGGLLNPAPWQQDGVRHLTQGPAEHVLYAGLRRGNPNLQRLTTEWAALPVNRFSEYREALPPEWADQNQVTDEIVQYLVNVQANLQGALAEVRRVLQ